MTSTPDSGAPKLFEDESGSESDAQPSDARAQTGEQARPNAPHADVPQADVPQEQSGNAEREKPAQPPASSTNGDDSASDPAPREVFDVVPATPTLEQLEIAQRALDEIAAAGAVGEVHDARQIAEQVLEIRYVCNLEGYPDWLWTVSLATIDTERATVLEVTLLPGEGSLVAPEWVPWAERLADYLASKEAGEEDDDSDDSDDDFDDFDDPDASPYSDTDDEPFSPDGDDDDDDSDDDDEDVSVVSDKGSADADSSDDVDTAPDDR